MTSFPSTGATQGCWFILHQRELIFKFRNSVQGYGGGISRSMLRPLPCSRFLHLFAAVAARVIGPRMNLGT